MAPRMDESFPLCPFLVTASLLRIYRDRNPQKSSHNCLPMPDGLRILQTNPACRSLKSIFSLFQILPANGRYRRTVASPAVGGTMGRKSSISPQMESSWLFRCEARGVAWRSQDLSVYSKSN